VKLVDLARECIRVIKDSGDEGIRSDILAQRIGVPKRRVYDVIAVLRALEMVRTRRRMDGTTVYWIDKSAEYVPRSDYDELLRLSDRMTAERNELQVQVAELKEQVRTIRARLRHDASTSVTSERTQFDTTMLTIRPLSKKGFKRVRNSGVEVVIETEQPGMIVDPVPHESLDSHELLRSLQRL